MPRRNSRTNKRPIETYQHSGEQRLNNPPAGLVTPDTDQDAGSKTYGYDPHLDPQLVWAGKAEHSAFDVRTVSLHVHERIEPGTIIDAVRRRNGEEAPEVPVYEAHRDAGSTADVDFWTARDTRDIANSHTNAVVLDTKVWEQSAAFYLDKHENVVALAKNAGLGFAIPYLHNGEYHEYVPDFLARLQYNDREVGTLILETKGHDPLEEVKRQAAMRWVGAVNRDGQYGQWGYRLVHDPAQVSEAVLEQAAKLAADGTH